MMLNALVNVYNSLLASMSRILTSDEMVDIPYPAIEWTSEDDDLDFSMIGSSVDVPSSIQWNTPETFATINDLIDSLAMPMFTADSQNHSSRRADPIGLIQEIYAFYFQGSTLMIPGTTFQSLQSVSANIWKLVSTWVEDPGMSSSSLIFIESSRFPLQGVMAQLYKIPVESLEYELSNDPSRQFSYLKSSIEPEFKTWQNQANHRIVSLEKEMGDYTNGGPPPIKKKREMSGSWIEEGGAEVKVAPRKKSRTSRELKEDLAVMMREAKKNSASAKVVFSSLD